MEPYSQLRAQYLQECLITHYPDTHFLSAYVRYKEVLKSEVTISLGQ